MQHSIYKTETNDKSAIHFNFSGLFHTFNVSSIDGACNLTKTVCFPRQMSAVVLFGVSGYLIYRLFIFRHFIGVNVQYPAILLLMVAIITCSVAWIGWRTAKSMHQIHVFVVGRVQ